MLIKNRRGFNPCKICYDGLLQEAQACRSFVRYSHPVSVRRPIREKIKRRFIIINKGKPMNNSIPSPVPGNKSQSQQIFETNAALKQQCKRRRKYMAMATPTTDQA